VPLTSPPPVQTSQRILDVAERLVQTQGFNGFSYADIAAELHVTKASLHYHFATKAELGTELIARYHETFQRALDAIDAEEDDARRKLRRYADLYASVLRKDRMCLCGMLASDFATLPPPMKEAVKRFFDANERWVARVLDEGRKARALRLAGAAPELARTLVAALEGAMLVSRSYGDVSRFEAAAERLVAQLVARQRT
jgi:TetR/AcrR family transcriptional regulator, transcriptional repressor for nem operon